MKSRFGVAAGALLAACLVASPALAGSNHDPQAGDGFDQLAPGLKARSMGSLIHMGLVHPRPVPAGPGVGVAPNNPFIDVTWGTAHGVSGGNGPNEPAAAMNPTNPTAALVSGNNFSNVPCTSISNTTDGGNTWAVTAAPNQCGYGDGVTGWAAANVNLGRTALNASLNPSGDGADLTLSRSTDNGVTWAAIASTIDVPNFFDDREYLWTDNNPASPFYGRMYVTEALFDPNGSGSYNTVTVRFSTDQGDTWSAANPLVDPSEFAQGLNHNEYPALAIQPSGTVVAVWHRGACCGVITTDNKVAWSRSTDGGVTWTSSATVTPGTIVDVPLSKTVVFNSTSPGGFRWSDTPNVAADPIDGTLYATWVQYRTDNDANSAAAYLSKSTDNGDTWSTPIIPFDNPNAELFQYMEWVSVSKAHIVHLTFSSGVGNNSTLAHFYVQSTDGGDTWSAPFQLSPTTYAPQGFMGDYQGNSVGGDDGSGNESILAAWCGNPGGVEQQWARIGTFVAASCTGNYIPSHHSGGSIVPGTTDTGNHCDDCSTSIALPFTFNFYDQAFTSAAVTSNGELDFQTTTGAPKSGCLPNPSVSYALFPQWDDLRTDNAGEGVFTSVSGFAPHRIFNIEWRAEYKSGGQAVSFEIRLYEDTSRFDFVYGSVPQTGSGAAVGAQKDTGSVVSQFACGGNSLANGEVITFFNSCCPALSTQGAIEATDIHQTGMLTVNGTPSSCGAPKPCPGPADSNPRSVDIYPFLNANDVTECVTVSLLPSCTGTNAMFAAAYLGFYDETNVCGNYLADGGTTSVEGGLPVIFSFEIPPSVPFTVVVGEVTPGAGCPSYNLDVAIPQPPTAVATGGGTVCQFHPAPLHGSGGLSCSWTPTTGLSDPNSCSPTATPPLGQTTYTLTVTDSCGASSTNAPTVTFDVVAAPDPTITVSGPTAFCEGGSVTLTATAGALAYQWFPFGQTTQSINAVASGNYYCLITGPNCQTTSDTVVVTVNSAPVAVASGSATICNGSSTPLTGSGAPNCSWTPVIGLDNPNSCTPNASPPVTTTYSLTVTDSIGCVSVNLAQVTVATNPLPTAGNNGPVCVGQTLQLTCNVISGATYSWTGPNGFSSGLRQPQIPGVTLADAGDYTVTATLVGCTPYTSTTTVAVNPGPAPVISTSRCIPPSTSGLTASVPANAGDTYAWTITGGTIDSGQGTDTISFTSGGPATLMTLSVDESNGTCSGSDATTMQVDFLDVPASNPFHSFVCTIARNGITAGCGGGNFCPGNNVIRSQMAVFLLRGEHGSTYLPPPATGIFGDVLPSNPFAPWIEQLYNEGITGGCSTNPLLYCPSNPVSRAGMAVFLLVAEHGTGYVPPSCAGIFTDVACPSPFADWIEQLYNEGITGGCSTTPLMYCPGNSVTRAQMSVFLTVTFALP